jgi:TRAP-type C4-dicarboxylate transport system substrate-binding protein
LLAGLAAASAAPLALAPARARAATSWTLYTYVPAATLVPAIAYTQLTEQAEKLSNGDLQIRLHLSGSLPIQATNITQAVADGVVQMADDGFFQGNIPISGILRLPMLISSDREFAIASAIVRPYIEKSLTQKGIVLLGGYLYPQQVAWSRNKLTSLADMQGQKMRVSSPEQGEFVKRFGGTPVTISPPDVPSALERGIVDGVFTASSGGGKIWSNFFKYSYRLAVNYFDALTIVNKDAYAKLSPDEQKMLANLVTQADPQVTAGMHKEDAEITAQLAAKGMVITKEIPSDVGLGIKTMAPYWNEWAQAHGPEAVEALAKIRAAVKH